MLHVTVGVDGTGQDVKFFGETSGHICYVDDTVDELALVGTQNCHCMSAGG